jgi:hypothetical protein
MEDNAKCSTRESKPICDQYLVTLTNVGAGKASGPVTIVDTLPRGLKPVDAHGENLQTESKFGCSVDSITTCRYEGFVAPGVTLAVYVEVEVEANATVGEVTNAVEVSSPGAPPVSGSAPMTLPNTINGPPAAFGISAFGFAAHGLNSSLDTQAGDHPSGVTNTVNLNTFVESLPGSGIPFKFGSVASPRDIVVYLPLGFLGNPTATSRCTELQLVARGGIGETECPLGSRIGEVTLFSGNGVSSSTNPEGAYTASAIYNMMPEAGYPAQFGLKAFNKPIPVYVSLVHTSSGYAVRAATPGIPNTVNAEGVALALFGEPSSGRSFFTNPDNCSGGPLQARVQVDSWVHPHQWVSREAVVYPGITGCNLLQFEPSVAMRPEVTQAEAPSGYEIKIKFPQNPEQFPVLATPQLKNVTVTLPEGMAISPGGGGGLTGCEATGPNGIDMPNGGGTPTEVGEGEALGPDDMTHLVPGHCPPQSQIGTVEIASPLLTSPLEGRLYVAQPKCGGTGQSECTVADAANGSLFGVYLEAEGSGVVVKLKGSVSANPATGQLTARFLENPQLPVSEVTVSLKGGGRAPLVNPRQCGEALMNADLTPWSSPVTPDAIRSAGFSVDWDGSGGVCPVTLPFAPALEAGTTNAQAGHFGAFTLTVGRGDRMQDLARLQVKLPEGLLGMLAKVPLCGEPQAREGTCGEGSLVGSTSVAAGSGPQPLGVQGRVYLTGPYGGAPFGLSVVVPAVAGPFNLGNVVARARIDVDPHTAAVAVTSDPLPQVLDGVPLRIQTLNVAIDRGGFIFNPTSCTAKQVTTTIEAEQGASASLSAHFAVEGCRNLPFKPSFRVSTQGNGTFGGGAKGKGASLDVKVSQAPGEAAIGKVDVQLPLALPSRLTTLQQACTEAQFASNPAGCPAGSNVGFAKATTPVLQVPLTGPAYLVSHGGAAFPDLVIVLQANERGGHIRIDLTGNTNIKKGITYSNFDTVPDAPISSFELTLPEGPHSVLAAIRNLCHLTKTVTVTRHITRRVHGRSRKVTVKVHRTVAEPLLMPTTITGQNGAVTRQNTKIAVTGCAAKKARKASGNRGARKRR